MNILTEIKTNWQSIPKEVKRFLKRALLIFIIWKLIYHLFLFNGRIIDKPLTDWSVKGTQKIMQIFYPTSNLMIKEEVTKPPELNGELAYMDFLFLNNKKIVGVADGCNALELYVLYVGFLLSFPSSIKRIFFFSITGIIAIYFANIIRLAALSSMNMHSVSAANMAHHYIFKMIVYALIFGLWILFTKKQMQDEKNS